MNSKLSWLCKKVESKSTELKQAFVQIGMAIATWHHKKRADAESSQQILSTTP